MCVILTFFKLLVTLEKTFKKSLNFHKQELKSYTFDLKIEPYLVD